MLRLSCEGEQRVVVEPEVPTKTGFGGRVSFLLWSGVWGGVSYGDGAMDISCRPRQDLVRLVLNYGVTDFTGSL